MKLKYLLLAVLLLGAVLCGLAINGFGSDREVSRSAFMLDTYITLTAYGPNADAAIDEALKQISKIEAAMSIFADTSEVSYINQAASAAPVKVSAEVAEVLYSALHYSKITDGLFDVSVKPLTDLWAITSPNPRVPELEKLDAALKLVGYENIEFDPVSKTVFFTKNDMGIDLGGIAKGYAADETARIFKKHNIRRAIINLGGNIVVMGQRKAAFIERLQGLLSGSPMDSRFRVGIQTPFAPTGEYCVIVRASDAAVVSSGSYERNFTAGGVLYHHIIDPRTGYPASNGIESVTVICPSSTAADALSTGIFVMGIEDGMEFADKCGVDVIIIDSEKRIYTNLDMQDISIIDPAYTLAK